LEVVFQCSDQSGGLLSFTDGGPPIFLPRSQGVRHESGSGTQYGVITPSEMLRLPSVHQGSCAMMSASEIYNCLRDLQMVATVPTLSEEQITELVKKKLIVRAEKSGGILLTQLGLHTKTGHA
jgi:hypothetical protein